MSIDHLLNPGTGPFGLPDYAAIRDEDFAPAFTKTMNIARQRIDAIAENPDAPDFANTIEALELAEDELSRVAGVFYNLVGADSTPARQAIEREMAPKLADFSSQVLLNPALYARVQAVPGDGLSGEQARVLDLYRQMFTRAGAGLDDAGRARMADLAQQGAVASTAFAQNVLAEEADWFLDMTAADLEGLPADLIAAMRDAGTDRGRRGAVLTLNRSLIVPFLQTSPRRDLRELGWRAWVARGRNGNDHDNRDLAATILALRHERAQMLGHADYAHLKLEPEMARTPDAVRDLLMQVWDRAQAKARADHAVLQQMMAEDGVNGALEAWDWRYYAEKRRARDHDFDEAALKPYLSLEAMLAAMFDVAHRLFRLNFRPFNAPLYHPDVRAWEVTRDGEHVAVFLGDYFARASKRSGAWCSAIRAQRKLGGDTRPIVVNVCNFAKGDPCLLGWDDARTLFHEFGHALHQMLSDVTYGFVSGTSVARDFVELPSQLYEHWLTVPAVLDAHARHFRSAARMPADLRDRLLAAQTFDQAAATVEYTASALVDLAFHSGPPPADPLAREAEILAELDMPPALAMRHATPHFAHVFAGEGYAAGYYSYMWSEVMDADAFAAFTETGDPFDPETAARLEGTILSQGGSVAPDDLYVAFRGRMPGVGPMLEGRGLA
ncbi:M3 family metallopeptidase [Paracoccus sp. p3-h83]|uniref:M3 family metallopeptidase n=1 Tax=Paracoccus sp. p3-h83 TaxID=3342805 RepID=UPI0035B8AD32